MAFLWVAAAVSLTKYQENQKYITFLGLVSRSTQRGDTVSLLNFHFCQKWALQAARPVVEKNPTMNYELILTSVFSWAKEVCRVHSKKLHNIHFMKKLFEIFMNFLGGQNHLFLGLAVLVILVIIVKGVYLRLLSLLSLVTGKKGIFSLSNH